jgi:hypothetical protein
MSFDASDDHEMRDLNCARCGRPMNEVLEAIVVSKAARPVAIARYPDGTAQMVCGACFNEKSPEGEGVSSCG